MTLSALALRQSDWRGVCVYMQKMELRNWWEYGEGKISFNELNEKALVDTMGSKSADFKDKFLF